MSPQRRIDVTAEQISAALEECGHDPFAAAARLGISYRTLHRRMVEFGLRRRSRYEATEPVAEAS